MAGATIAPTFVPALNRLVANARSRLGNQRATALIDDGKFPPSLRPRAARARLNPDTEETSACAAAASRSSEVTVAAGYRSGRKLRLKGKGLPSAAPGDLYLVLDVVFPPAATPEQKQAYADFAKAFPQFDARSLS